MTCQTTAIRFILAAVLLLAVLATACRQPAATAGEPDEAILGSGVSPYDVETTDLARVLGGIPPARREAFTTLFELRPWWDYQAESRSRWVSAWSATYEPVRTWANVELKKAGGNCQTLLHPFGETDFLSAYLMFPGCEGYVLVGSEPVGQLPALENTTPGQFAAIADDVRRAFPEVFPRGGAGRGRAPAPRRAGALRLLLVQLVHLNARIVSASRFDLASNGRPLEAVPIRGGNARPAALSITFEVPNGQPQSLVYLPADLDDAAVKRRPGLWTFLRLQAPFTTLLSPAAGLEGERATLVRDLLVAQSRAILQDRPVLSPRLLDPRRWTVSTLERAPGGAFGPDATPTLALRKGAASSPAQQ